jgi:hypothetical protein
MGGRQCFPLFNISGFLLLQLYTNGTLITARAAPATNGKQEKGEK